jgi:hypothetical protein
MRTIVEGKDAVAAAFEKSWVLQFTLIPDYWSGTPTNSPTWRLRMKLLRCSLQAGQRV